MMIVGGIVMIMSDGEDDYKKNAQEKEKVII